MELLRILKVYSLDQLRGLSRKSAPGLEVLLWPQKYRYVWDPSNRGVDDGLRVIALTEDSTDCCSGGDGRFVLESYSTLTSGADAPVLTVLEEELDTGSIAVGSSTAWTVITGSDIVFSLTTPKDVAIDGEATAGVDGFNRTNAQLGIRITNLDDMTSNDYPGTYANSGTLGDAMITPITAQKGKTLAAANWKVQLIFRAPGPTVDANIVQTADFPTRIRVMF